MRKFWVSSIVTILALSACSKRSVNLTYWTSSVCQLHGEQMTKTNVPIVYGLIGLTEWGKALDAASTNHFPNSENQYLGGCIVGAPENATIYRCAQCQRAREQWIAENPPPVPTDVAGVWVGFDEIGNCFTRLELDPDFTGYCGRLAPAGFSGQVEGYRVVNWMVDHRWEFTTTLIPATTNAYPMYLHGRYDRESLKLECGETNRPGITWKRKLTLYRESQFSGVNQEIRDKLRELERK